MLGPMSGLIEHLCVVGLLFWFWRLQTSSLPKDGDSAEGKDRALT